MKRFLTGFLGLLCFALVSHAQVDKGTYYKAFASEEESTIDQMLTRLEGQKASPRVNAYKGALTMKKAGYVKGVGGKMKTFKKGALMLEDEIKSNPDNTEFRFLRLAIQENAPNILKYNKEIDEDKQAVVAGYDKLDAELKNVIADYARDSKALKASELK